MLELFSQFLADYGYLAIGILVLLEGLGVPLPGETAVMTTATFAARGALDIVGVAIATSIGTITCATISYWIGRSGGREFLEKYGQWIWLDRKRLAKTERYYEKYGLLTIFFGRYIAPLRAFGGFIAGVARMPFGTFMVANVIGGIVWAVTFTAVGFYFGRNLVALKEWILEIILVTALLVVVIVGFSRRAARRRHAVDARSYPHIGAPARETESPR